MTITTTYKTNAHGRGQIVARTAGRQLTTNYDHSMNLSENHGAAAARLAKSIGMPRSQAMAGSCKADHANNKVVFSF